MKSFSFWKNLLISIIVIVCLALDAAMIYVQFFADEEVNSYTFEIGTQTITTINQKTGEESEDSKYFIEVSIYDNCYEIKFNYFVDENQDAFYSQGLQFYNTSTSESLFDLLNLSIKNNDDEVTIYYSTSSSSTETTNYYSTDSSGINTEYGYLETSNYTTAEGFMNRKKYYYPTFNTILDGRNYSSELAVSNYASSDNYENVYNSTNALDSDSSFKIQIGDDIYLMKFKGTDYDYLTSNNNFYIGQSTESNVYKKSYLVNFYYYVTNTFNYYRSCDIYYFAELIYNSFYQMSASASSYVLTAEFGDLFDYYAYNDETGQYDTVITDTSKISSITNDIKSYYQILVNVHSGNMTSSSQSIFNKVDGAENYDEEESETAYTDYYYGRTILDIDQSSFYYILDTENNILTLQLSDEFKEYYPELSTTILRITLELELNGITFNGFVEGSLDGYTIYKVILVTDDETKDITSEVI